MTAADPCFLSIAEAAALIEAKRLSPVELTRAYLDRIERLNGRLNAYVRVLHDEALAAARAARGRNRRWPLSRAAARPPDRPQRHLRHRRRAD
jgi:Asp-tRNA(Asn)/Glu-tRNA(Gln) amidotransferase A subunit family amidase